MSLADTYIIFVLDGASYAVRSEHVLYVEMLEHVTLVPNTAPAVDGVVFSRGQVVPAINLRVRFGLQRRSHDSTTRLIYLKVRERLVALIVDSAKEFQRIAADMVRPVQETLVGIEGNYVEGVVTLKDRTVLVLDVGQVLTLEEITLPEGAPVPTAVS